VYVRFLDSVIRRLFAFSRISTTDICIKVDIAYDEHGTDVEKVENKPIDNASASLHVEKGQTTTTHGNITVRNWLKFEHGKLDPKLKAEADTCTKYASLQKCIPQRLENKTLHSPPTSNNCRSVPQSQSRGNAPLPEVFTKSRPSGRFIIFLAAPAQHDPSTLIALNKRN
jgi:hypothetical protein